MSRFHKMHSNLRQQTDKRSRSFDAVLSLPVPVVRNGERRTVSAEEAFLLDLRHKSREGDVSASELMADYADVFEDALQPAGRHVAAIITRIWQPGSVNPQLESLRMAKKFDRYSKRSYMKLEPWLIQAALDRLGDRQLSPQEQHAVLDATRTPHKVRWPDWWEIHDGS